MIPSFSFRDEGILQEELQLKSGLAKVTEIFADVREYYIVVFKYHITDPIAEANNLNVNILQ